MPRRVVRLLSVPDDTVTFRGFLTQPPSDTGEYGSGSKHLDYSPGSDKTKNSSLKVWQNQKQLFKINTVFLHSVTRLRVP